MPAIKVYIDHHQSALIAERIEALADEFGVHKDRFGIEEEESEGLKHIEKVIEELGDLEGSADCLVDAIQGMRRRLEHMQVRLARELA